MVLCMGNTVTQTCELFEEVIRRIEEDRVVDILYMNFDKVSWSGILDCMRPRDS